VTLTVSVTSSARVLPRPARNALAQWSHRASCILTLESDTGVRGQGEAAPLPDFSPDTLQGCEQALSTLDVREIPDRLEPNHDLIGELRRASARIPPNLPAARAAFEAALLDLWARGAALPAWSLLVPAGTTPTSRAVAALLSGDPEHAVAHALAAHARGLATFKFKIGRPGALPQELAALKSLRAKLGPLVRLRLDANQALSVAQATEYLPRFAALELEFIEEPCAPQDLAQLSMLGLPLARDESLAMGAWPQTGDRAVILKPSLLGGVSACFALAEAARAIGAHVILSHAFEGALGLGLSAALALSIGSETLAHGLDLEGAQLEQLRLPYYCEAAIHPWSAPGFGLREQP
jgi:o-succinylbenzoate synthase